MVYIAGFRVEVKEVLMDETIFPQLINHFSIT
jgi:hypothetical protein